MAAPVLDPVDLTSALNNIRRLSGSSLPHQAKPAQLLIAIEQTLAASLTNVKDNQYPATGYFASVLSCISKATSAPTSKDATDYSEGGLMPALLYLMAAVIAETPREVVINHLQTLLPTLVTTFDLAQQHPPALRSLIQIFTTIFLISPSSTLTSSPLLKKAWNHMLELNLDSRPKVRHLAQECVRKVLTTPVPPKVVANDHPYLGRARDWAVGVLKEEEKGKSQAKQVKFAGVPVGGEDMQGKNAIWVVQGLRGWVSVLSEEDLSALCPLLLKLPRLPHLTPQIYSLVSLLLAPPPISSSSLAAQSSAPTDLPNLPVILTALLESPPPASSPADQVEYVSAVSSAMLKLARQDPYVSSKDFFMKAWETLWSKILTAPTTAPEARRKAAEGLGNQGLIRYCISEEMVSLAVTYKSQGGSVDSKRQKMKVPLLTKLISQLEGAINTRPLLLPFLLPILTALVSRLRQRSAADADGKLGNSKGRSAAQVLMLDLLVSVSDLRIAPGFEEKEKVDDLVGMAFEVMGVEAVLNALPLNIEPDASGKPPIPGRAHLLPLMRARITNDSIRYFTTTLVPLSERLFERKVKAETEGRAGEAKVWEVVIGQIWDCLPGFLDVPRDLRVGFTTPFAQLLAQLLYTQPLLRASILRALSTLINSTRTLSNSSAPTEELLSSFGVDQSEAALNLAFLKGLAGEMLAVLFNLFSSVPRENRGMVGEVIGLWLSVMGEEEIAATYMKVATHLSSALTGPAPTVTDPSLPPVSHTMLDLIIILVPYLPSASASSLFQAASTGNLIENDDAAIQKKAYRVLARLVETGDIKGLQGDGVDKFVMRLVEVGQSIGAGAQRDRMLLLTALVPKIPVTQLHIVPTLITEAVLGTKEVNEKARNAAFDLLVVMAQKMSQGGVISRAMMGGNGDDDTEMADVSEDANASVEEYITMVAAGLAANTPHMISASITALSRLLFEFQGELSAHMIDELVSTVVVFVASKNREIVKSALGFIKVAVVSLPASAVRPHLAALVPALLGWVHDHKNHFKTKTIHIFERMIRKFGYDDVYKHGGPGDQKKVLEHIKKRKDRAKRQKAAKTDAGGEDEDMEEDVRKPTTGNAFEDALYGSASEEESDGAGPSRSQAQQRPIKGRKDKRAGAHIQEDDDHPMDLLDRSIAGRVSANDPSLAAKRRKPGQEAATFKTDKESGRMVIDEESDNDAGPSGGDALGGSAYQTALTSVDGMVRDSKGHVKFNKNTKRGRATEAENELGLDTAIADEEASRKKPKTKRQIERLGGEYKAKRAGGDIKRVGQSDPYSYVPLSQAGKRKGGGAKVSLTNKKRGSRQ